MSIDKDKEFDLLVRSMMENAEEEVPSGIWENIAGKLDGNSTPVVLWWRRPLWAVAAAAVLVAGVVATLKLVPSGTTSGNLVADKVEIVSKGETRESPVSLPELEEELVPQSIPSPSRVKAVAKPHSEEVASEIDKEVKAVIDECYERAKEILTEHRDLLDKIAAVLLEREVLVSEDFDELMKENQKSELPETRIDNLPKSNTEFLA